MGIKCLISSSNKWDFMLHLHAKITKQTNLNSVKNVVHLWERPIRKRCSLKLTEILILKSWQTAHKPRVTGSHQDKYFPKIPYRC